MLRIVKSTLVFVFSEKEVNFRFRFLRKEVNKGQTTRGLVYKIVVGIYDVGKRTINGIEVN
jgi:hypothetical protein